MQKFELKRHYPGQTIPCLINVAMAACLAVQAKAGITGQDGLVEGEAASGNFLGFVPRAVTAAGEQDTVLNSVYPGRLEGDFRAGEVATLVKAEAFEAEGGTNGYLYTGDADEIKADTAIGTKLSFKNGLVKIASGADVSYFQLAQVGLTPVEAGALRIRAEAIR